MKMSTKVKKFASQVEFETLETEYSSRDSFGNKAKVITTPIGNNGNYVEILVSYETIVAYVYTNEKGTIIGRIVNEKYPISNTTLSHIRDFFYQNCLKVDISKKELLESYLDAKVGDDVLLEDKFHPSISEMTAYVWGWSK